MESVLRQTWPDMEYLLVVGDSVDGTREVVEGLAAQHAPTVRCVFEPQMTIYEALNKGISLATGDVVGLLHADDVLAADDVVERVAEAFGGSSKVLKCGSSKVRESETANGAKCTNRDNFRTLELSKFRTEFCPDVIYGDIRFVPNRLGATLDALRTEKTVRYYSARHWRPWMLQWGFMPPHPSVYIRRECFDRLGDYALDYKIAADYALLIRFLRAAKLRCQYIPMCFVDMRVGGMSTKNWRSNLLLNQEIVRGNREAGYFCCLAMLLPKYAFKVWEFLGPRVKRFKRG